MPDMRYIILVSGWCGSGKDVLADYIVKKFKFIKMSVADELKQSVAKRYKFDHSLTQTQAGKSTVIYNEPSIKTVRDLLIEDSLFQKEMYGDNVFIKSVSKKILTIDRFQFDQIKKELPKSINNVTSHMAPITYVEVSHLDKVQESPKHIVIPDFRFKHEYEHMFDTFHGLCKHNVINEIVTIRINRFDKHPLDSPSEKDLDDFNFDYIIENFSDLESYLDKVDKITREILTKKL